MNYKANLFIESHYTLTTNSLGIYDDEKLVVNVFRGYTELYIISNNKQTDCDKIEVICSYDTDEIIINYTDKDDNKGQVKIKAINEDKQLIKEYFEFVEKFVKNTELER